MKRASGKFDARNEEEWMLCETDGGQNKVCSHLFAWHSTNSRKMRKTLEISLARIVFAREKPIAISRMIETIQCRRNIDAMIVIIIMVMVAAVSREWKKERTNEKKANRFYCLV